MSVRMGPPELLHVFSAAPVSTGTIATGITAVARQRVYLYKCIVMIGATAVSVQFNDSVTGQLSQPFQLTANGSIVLDLQNNGDAWWFTAQGSTLTIVQSGTSSVTFDIWYLQAS